MKNLLVLALLLALGGAVMPESFAAQGDVPTVAAGGTLFVTGTGEVFVTPDIARITVGVQTRAVDSAQAASENADKTAAVIKAVRALGVAEKDIQTEGYNIYPQFDYQKQPPVLVEYQVSNSVRITVRKLADAGKVLDAALKSGANVAGGIAFDVANPQKAQDEALTKAVADAVRKATLMAKAAGISAPLRLLELSEGVQNAYTPPMPMAAMAEGGGGANTPVQAGETRITATVSARFRMP